ncbi:MaoC/PaaZ C-terminal domain-containing protein [Rhodococcus qingshengii]|uniref:MaoC-like domain-containing protein n=1 Tax=Rhodococcus qingshengii TaxID=334542 RepID=A0A2A5J9C9_RHOSG|nr:MaoC/PaaZ C-terminal domain-containing protein [Rhodococcus qingshengii]PCK25829.1 hypothetical protein CHR55_18975 [Rhodococcus qingshengii]
MITPAPLYAEDLTVGSRMELGSWVVSREQILAFAGQWDPLDIHCDETFAATGPFGGLIASGMHTMSILQRLTATAFLTRVAVIAGRRVTGAELLKPVRPDTLLVGTRSIDAVTLRADGRAVVVTTGQLEDQAGDVVLRMTGELLVARRPEQPPGDIVS